MPEHLQPDRLPSDMVFFLQIGETTIDLSAMSYGDVFAVFQTTLGAVRSVLHQQALSDEQHDQQTDDTDTDDDRPAGVVDRRTTALV